MSNLYNLGGASQAPAPPNINSTGRSAPAGSSSGNNLPQGAANDGLGVESSNVSALIEQAVNDLADYASSHQRSLSFSVNKDTGDTIIVVRDSLTEEVVRQIPSEFAVQLAQNLNRLRETFQADINSGGANPLDFLGSKGNLFDTSA